MQLNNLEVSILSSIMNMLYDFKVKFSDARFYGIMVIPSINSKTFYGSGFMIRSLGLRPKHIKNIHRQY